MKQKRENLCLFLGAGFSLFLHAGLFFLLFLQMRNAPEPGGSGLLMDAFLVSGGDGFYQTGVPWGDFDFKPGRKGTPPAVEEKTAEPEKSFSEKPSSEINKKTEKKSETVLAAPVRKKTSLPVKKQKKAAALKKKAGKVAAVPAKDPTPAGQNGSGTQPYGGVVGDAPGFGAGRGSGIGVGSGRGIGDIKAARYFVRLRRLFQRRLKYPEELENQKISGRAVVRFRILKDGKLDVNSVVLAQTSGHEILDRQALKTILEAVRLPAPPYGEMTIEIPIVFRVYH